MSTHEANGTLTSIAVVGLGLGGVLGMVGSFVKSEAWRGLAWGIDGIALVTASALLAVHFIRQEKDLVAAGYLVFAIGQGLVLSGSAMSLQASTPVFGAGTGLWAAGLMLISLSRVFPTVVRLLGMLAAIMFAATALQIFHGAPLHPKSEPLPFFAYPVFVATMAGWIWTLRKRTNQTLRTARAGAPSG